VKSKEFYESYKGGEDECFDFFDICNDYGQCFWYPIIVCSLIHLFYTLLALALGFTRRHICETRVGEVFFLIYI